MCKLQLLMITTVITLLAGPGVSVLAVDSENNVRLLFKKLEEALTKNSTLLFQLQSLFLFNQRTKTCYNARVLIEVGTLNRGASSIFHNCQRYRRYECEYGNWTSGYNNYTICPEGLGEQSSQLLLGYQTTSLLEAFDPLFYDLITLSITNNNNSNTFDCGLIQLQKPVPDIILKLFIDTIDILPSRNDLTEAERILLSLAKGYAKTNGQLTETQYSEISTVRRPVFCEFRFSDALWWVFVLVLAIFYSLNILVLGVVIIYLQRSLLWLHAQDKEITDLYAITTAVVVLLNCSSFILYVVTIVQGVENILIIALSFVIPIVVIEVLFVMYHTCRRTSTNKKKLLYRSLHFFACCNIIWFIHRHVTDAIIATLNFITSPAQTVAVVSTYICTIASVIIALKIMVSRCKLGTSLCSKDCFKHYLPLSFVLFIGISTLIFVVSVGFLYVILVNYRLDSTGVGAFLLSFVQPVIFVILGVYFKKQRFYKILMENESTTNDKLGTSAEMKDVLEEEQASAINLEESVDTFKQNNSNDCIIASTQHNKLNQIQQASLSGVHPVLHERA